MARTRIEVCACTRCSMMGSMEIAQYVVELQGMLDENDELKFDIELINVSKPEITDEDPALAPVVLVNGDLYPRANASIIMDAILSDKEAESSAE